MKDISDTPTASKFSRLTNNFTANLAGETSSGSIYRNILVLLTGAATARAVGVITIPIITRIYTPEHFGVLSVFASMVALMAPLGTLRYSVAIPLPKNDGLAANVFFVSVAALTIVTLLVSLFFGLFGAEILGLFSMLQLLPYWWLVVVTLLGMGFYEILSGWATRKKAFMPLAKTAIMQAGSSAAVKILLGLMGLKPLGLLIGHAIGQTGGGSSLAMSFYDELKGNVKHVSIKRLIFVTKHYANMPMLRLPSQFLLAFSMQGPLLLASIIFGAGTTGQLGLAFTAMALPVSLLGSTTGQAYYAEIAKIGPKYPEKILQVTQSVTKKLFLVSLPPFLILLLGAPTIFDLVFGSRWVEAGIFSRMLSFYLVAQFVSTPLVNALSVFGKQDMFLRMNLVRSVMVSFVFGTAYFFNLNAYSVVGLYSFLLTLNYSFNSFTVFRVIQSHINGKGKA